MFLYPSPAGLRITPSLLVEATSRPHLVNGLNGYKHKPAQDDGSAATDENGNPVESLGLNPSQYKSMR
ncbi:hypothetical protein MAR_010416, partial [Mya arenaria]